MRGLKVKIGLFADPHFSSADITCTNRYNNKSLRKIEEAFKSFRENKCDLVICLGDLIDQEEDHTDEIADLIKISEIFSKYEMKISVVMGNHDCSAFDKNEFYEVLGQQYRPENIYCRSKNIIFIDACYYENGMSYKRGFADWTNTFFPKTEELQKVLSNVDGDSYIFMHQNIDPDIRSDHRVSNDNKIREILENSNKVKAVFQGHYHSGHMSEVNGIRYITYPAMCENELAYFVFEI